MQYHKAVIQNKEAKKITKKYFQVDIGDTVFLVMGAKRNGAKENCVLRLNVDHIYVNEQGTVYTGKVEKVVTGSEKDISKYVSYLCFKDDNIDTGYSTIKYIYPVFTTKEKCINWLKGE